MIERKCPNCATWNKDEKFCTQCGTALDPVEIEKIEARKRKEEEANKPKDKYDLFVERMKNSDNTAVRIFYKIFSGVTTVFAAIGAFLAWIVAMANA